MFTLNSFSFRQAVCKRDRRIEIIIKGFRRTHAKPVTAGCFKASNIFHLLLLYLSMLIVVVVVHVPVEAVFHVSNLPLPLPGCDCLCCCK